MSAQPADADFYALELLLDDGDRALLHRVRDFMSFRQGGLPWDWLTVAAPPAMATSRSPAAVRAWSRAAWMPSVTKVKVVPPCMVSGSRGWWVSTNTGAW